ncbi:hypothetical protein O3Q52_07555 [Streptomyces sp. ActVer]|uniref:hypothetical protein n=1 Tax=Streptomyces sp. ActVer TaxID=3014558 RepID=UPI0022B40BA7|nr:hypothetical protein [Streptomyces sp. ActVer]MCZ4508060.1 hypothetical protein [Streptomyces sp. ActVer]
MSAARCRTGTTGQNPATCQTMDERAHTQDGEARSREDNSEHQADQGRAAEGHMRGAASVH